MTTAASWRLQRALVVVLVACATAVTAMQVPAATQPASQQGRIVYVSPSGSDSGTGSHEHPWRTLDHAFRHLRPGDTLLVRGGTYREQLVRTPYTSATPAAPILVRAHPGERPVVQGLLNIRHAHHWTFDGLNVHWDPAVSAPSEPLVKIMDGVGWVFRNAEVAGARSYAGVFIGSNTPGQPAHWRLEGNCIRDTHKTGSNGFTDHNIYIQNKLGAQPGVVERNVIYGAPNGMNIKLGAGADRSNGASNVSVRYNVLVGGAQNLLVAYHAHDITFERNVMGPITVGRADYSNIRGYENRGPRNVARDNVAFGAASFIRNTPAESTAIVGYGVLDGGGNRFPVNPGYSAVARCTGYVPTADAALAYGHAAKTDRVAGTGRILTSVELSQATFPRPGTGGSVVVARADAYPDALAGAPLAAKVGAPVLLTGSDRLHPAAAGEVRRLGARVAYLLGGTTALSPRVEQDLAAAGIRDVRRIAGANRYDTARLVGQEVGGDHAYVVEGANPDPSRGWPDAVAVSSLAARTRRPILLATRDTLPEPTRAALASLPLSAVDVVGGRTAVADAVVEAVRAAAGEARVERIAGNSRYGTSLAVARKAVEAGADPARTWLATGRNWPDALGAGPAAAAAGGLLLLVDGANLAGSPGTRDWVYAHRARTHRLHVVGGSGAVNPPVEDALARILR